MMPLSTSNETIEVRLLKLTITFRNET